MVVATLILKIESDPFERECEFCGQCGHPINPEIKDCPFLHGRGKRNVRLVGDVEVDVDIDDAADYENEDSALDGMIIKYTNLHETHQC